MNTDPGLGGYLNRCTDLQYSCVRMGGCLHGYGAHSDDYGLQCDYYMCIPILSQILYCLPGIYSELS